MTNISRDALLLLLGLLESTAARYSRSALVDFHGHRGEELIASQFVQPVAPAKLAAADDDDGYPVAVKIDRERDMFGYHDPVRGWTNVDETTFRLYRADIRTFLLGILRDALRLPQHGIAELVPELVWEAGQIRIVKKELTSLWFARRLHDRDAFTALAQAIAKRPSLTVRLVLTSTPTDSLFEPSIAMTRIISVADVLSMSDPDRIDWQILELRFDRSQVSRSNDAVHLSEDGRILTINGRDEIHFRGKIQVAIIRKIVAAYKAGKAVVASEVLESVHSASRTFQQAFTTKWKELAPFMNNEDGVWRLEP